ncbi:MAG: phosphoribosylformylglycinamidine synthase, purS protein [Candidatus Taylorbacteria bacterium RIFCSPHIGHO2_01_FULL_46_22b]|uniref:Phosphoribosylformylglycinamidine synthase subunit PurS n=1 Tax=Candidatus Taylorbacteria bacterium RIFCSPHIGHO2_01_FULL_46_22b TaxID=1802301 RepID=A0A1G2M262_9BACT|nr:MAG: phosphoribosylformylglycinamidine synthase, purS protein [Candidatus Taylorbacteria bacterium RIFCSPHIGHO2_01_FULL_46_22b]
MDQQFDVTVLITPRGVVLDPPAVAVLNALKHFEAGKIVTKVHMGRFISLTVTAKNPEEAKAQVDQMCRDNRAPTLIYNPVMETFRIETAVPTPTK